MFAEFVGLAEDDTQNKPVLVVQIYQALIVHTQVEEELFYPALYQVHSKDLTVLLAEAAEEHQVVKTLIADLMDIPSHEARFAAKITVLGKYVLSHAKEEEQEMFKLIKQHLSQEELGALGEQIEGWERIKQPGIMRRAQCRPSAIRDTSDGRWRLTHG